MHLCNFISLLCNCISLDARHFHWDVLVPEKETRWDQLSGEAACFPALLNAARIPSLFCAKI